ncbi:hypothetical protein SNE40_019828 [Patella caerulea]|uniref:Uncharacterized protein n=1 Tax=Patella caerulea TaxID=87958 RepID=A0AAN8IZX8_PATCE
MATEKPETVHQKTFNKWPFKDEFTILQLDNDSNITKLQCKICSTHLSVIRVEAGRGNVKGIAFKGIVNLSDGVECVHRGNLFRHIKAGRLHDWAEQKFGNTSTTTTSVQDDDVGAGNSDPGQAKIDVLINSTSTTCYRSLFNIALEEKPFSEFPALIEHQRKR